MNKISCLIADDEPMALALLARYIAKTPFLELKATCNSAIEAMEYLHAETPIALFFLDIQMPELSGLAFSKLVPSTSKIIFTTAFDQYAIEGYKVNALDYLLKPFDYVEFLTAATKAKMHFDQQVPVQLAPPVKAADYMFVKSEYKQVKINFHAIQLIEGLKDYVKIYVEHQAKPILTLMSLKKLEEELPATQFMRIHRSYIVALDKIEAIERNHVIIHQHHISIAPQYKQELLAFIEKRSI